MYNLGVMHVPLLLVLRALSGAEASLANTPHSKLTKAAWKDPVSKPATELHTHTERLQSQLTV